MTDHDADVAAVLAERRRLRSCVEVWPECQDGDYNPRCCRFPKSCSCLVYDERFVADDDLEVTHIEGTP